MSETRTPDPRPFRERGFQERYSRMGDEAEGAYKLDRERRRISHVRWGLERPPFTSAEMYSLPLKIRYAADFLEPRQRATEARLVEVKGCGADEVVKLKTETLTALEVQQEHDELPVWLFVWNSKRRRVFEVPLHVVQKLAAEAREEGRMGVFDPFGRPKDYYELRWLDIVGAWDAKPRRLDGDP